MSASTSGLIAASIFWTWAHFAAHFGIAGGYLAAVSRNDRTLLGLMRLRFSTRVFGAGFFLFCGVTHMSLALKFTTSPLVLVTDELQLICIWGFLIGLFLDARRAVLRLSMAFAAIIEEFDGLVVLRGERGEEAVASGEGERLAIGGRVVATIEEALFARVVAADVVTELEEALPGRGGT